MSFYLATIYFDPNPRNPLIQKTPPSSISVGSLDELKREIFQYISMESLRLNIPSSILYFKIEVESFKSEEEHMNTTLERHKKINPYHWHQTEGLYHPDWLFELFTKYEGSALENIPPILTLGYCGKFGLWLEINYALKQFPTIADETLCLP